MIRTVTDEDLDGFARLLLSSHLACEWDREDVSHDPFVQQARHRHRGIVEAFLMLLGVEEPTWHVRELTEKTIGSSREWRGTMQEFQRRAHPLLKAALGKLVERSTS